MLNRNHASKIHPYSKGHRILMLAFISKFSDTYANMVNSAGGWWHKLMLVCEVST